MSKTAVVILTHFLNQGLIDMFQRLRAEAPEGYDVFIALNLGNAPLELPAQASFIRDFIYLVNTSLLTELPYSEKCRPEGWSGKGWTFHGNADTIVLSFFRNHPAYAFYWGIEYDVHYEGRWDFLFRRFEASKADLLGTMLNDAGKVPKRFPMRPPFRDGDGRELGPENAIVGFFPIHRVSHRFLKVLDREYARGWNGHYEFTWGTIARRHGFEIEDIGGNGPYVKPHNRNVFYFNSIFRWDIAPGTFIWRPAFTRIHRHENTLWHPVKPEGDYFNHYPKAHAKGMGPCHLLKHAAKYIAYNAVIWCWFRLFWRSASSSPVPSAAQPLPFRQIA